MPIYEYVCSQCGEEFEKRVGFTETEPAPTCPKCQGQDTHKKVSKVGSFGASAFNTPSSASNCGSGGRFR